MGNNKRTKVWDHNLMVWKKPGTIKVLAIADVVEKASTLQEWDNRSDKDKEQVVTSVYLSLRRTKKVRKYNIEVNGKTKPKTETLDPKEHGYDDSVLYVSYLVKKMTEYGCDRDEAVSLWNKVKKELESKFKSAKKEFKDLSVKPPEVVRSGRSGNKSKSIDDQLKAFFDEI